ncbi:MAG: hypothetical protein JKY30_08660 [Flavobacteriales bacterium]|nr:hypothetical protein [Flavobacteriales bacterium]
MKKNKHIILFLFIGLQTFIFAQTEANFDKQIEKLNNYGKQIITSENDEGKYTANENYKTILKEVLEKNASFNYNFDSLKTISILKENDLKIYNWAIPLTDGTFKYFAFLQIRKSENEFNIIELIDKSATMKSPEYKMGTNKSWYGALYYKIIYEEKLGENYYTLLALDFNNLLTNKKIIDVVNISNSKAVKFGAPIFKMEGKRAKRRIIFEYAENVVMSLKYHQKIKVIVFDRLVPASSKLKGVYEYYGPALEVLDAYSLDKGQWNLIENIDIKLDPSLKDYIWKKPVEAIIK